MVMRADVDLPEGLIGIVKRLLAKSRFIAFGR